MRILVETSGCTKFEFGDDDADFDNRSLEGEDQEGRPGEGEERADLRDNMDPGSL